MSISLRKLAARLIAAVMTVSAVTAANAAALEQPVAVLSSSLNASVGTVLTSDEVTTAAKAYSRAKADAEAQARAAAAAKAAADAKAAAQARADAEAKKKAEEEAKALATLITAPVGSALGQLFDRLPRDRCDQGERHGARQLQADVLLPVRALQRAPLGVSKTASGATPAEGRTIAVDSSIIPLGSRVYIEGYGTFIAEDTGSAIKNSKIDIFVSTHERARRAGRPVRKRLPSRLRENRRDREKRGLFSFVRIFTLATAAQVCYHRETRMVRDHECCRTAAQKS